MYTDINLEPGVRGYLESLERELQRPIRVISGRGRRLTPQTARDWNHNQWAAGRSAWSDIPEELRQNPQDRRRRNTDNAITIVSYGAPVTVERSYFPDYELPDSWWDRSRHELRYVEDAVLFAYEPAVAAIQANSGTDRNGFDLPYGWITDHVFFSSIRLDRLQIARAIDLERVIGQHVRRCVADGIAEEIARTLEEAAMEHWVSMLTTRSINQLQTSERTLGTLERSIGEHQQQLQAFLTQRRDLIALVQALRNSGEMTEEHAREEWRRITEHPRIRDLEMTASMLSFNTDEIIITDPRTGAQRTLGVFAIEIGYGTDEGYLRFRNLTNSRDGRDHPHVPHNEAPCLGNMHGPLMNAISSRDFPLAIELIFQYLESYNPDDVWGSHASAWFGYPDEVHPEFNTNDAAETVAV
jgi:hypothetical protein